MIKKKGVISSKTKNIISTLDQKGNDATLLLEIAFGFHVKQKSFSLPLWCDMKGSHLKFFCLTRNRHLQ